MEAESYKALELITKSGAPVFSPRSPYASAMGLINTHKLNEKEYFRLGMAVRVANLRGAWYWIDWLIGAKKRWGEDFPQVLLLFGEYNPKSVMDSINLGSWDFPIYKRKWNLSPSHYREVRTLPDSAIATLLSLAEQKKWSSSGTLRDEVRKLRGNINPPPPTPTPDDTPDAEDALPATTLAEAFKTPQKLTFLKQGSKDDIANLLAGAASRFEKVEYGYYELEIKITKVADFVLDNLTQEGVILNVDAHDDESAPVVK